MKYQELEILVKFCSNRVDIHKFIELMMPRYNNKSYIENLWTQFRDNPMMFIIARNETELFDGLMLIIKDSDYKG